MKSGTYIRRSIWYYRKQHLGILLATILATAVLTGALIVGDSVKYSLTKLVELRLGKAEYALITADRFVSPSISEKIGNEINAHASSVLFLETIAISSENNIRKNKVQLLGIDSDFWSLNELSTQLPKRNEVVISQNLARYLQVAVGDNLLLRIRNADVIPINTPFTDNTEPTVAVRVKIAGIASDSELGRFSLRNDQKPPYNIFIDREYIAEKINLQNKVNVILVESENKISTDLLNSSFTRHFTIEDAGLQLNAKNGYSDLISERVFIDSELVSKLTDIEIPKTHILTYFTNSIENKNNSTPYSFISAVDRFFFNKELGDNEIIINSWLAEDLKAGVGDSLIIKYFTIGALQELTEREAVFVVSEILELQNIESFRSLMPSFPGLKDASSCGDWEAGIPIDLEKVRDKDEEYWEKYKGIPKAFISSSTGIDLWENNFGQLTLIRFLSEDNNIEQKITEVISPSDLGFEFVNLLESGNRAAKSGVDFGQLFLSLSFFIIFSALLLLVLIQRLNLLSRQFEIGLFKSLGIGQGKILQLRLKESIGTIIIGAIFGGILGVIYNELVMIGLNSVWNDAIHADMIMVHIKLSTIITGICTGIILSAFSVYFPTRTIIRRSVISTITKVAPKRKRKYTAYVISILSLTSAIYLLVTGLSASGNIDSGIILTAAFLIILGLIALTIIVLNILSGKQIKTPDIFNLAVKNLSNNMNRSISSIGLLAIGIFTIFVTGANRLTFEGSEEVRQSGTGGFNYWMETTVPLAYNLNDERGRSEFGLDIPATDIDFMHLSRLKGDDASCLNLNQVQQPSILGIDPVLFDSLDVFDFATLLKESDAPWLELKDHTIDGVIPAIADQTVIQWGLMKSIGDTISYLNEFGETINLVLVGGLKPSIFQGNILIDDSVLFANFPSSAGSNLMLIDVKPNSKKEAEGILKRQLRDMGVEITSTTEKLKGYYSVTNTYLTIFLFLGGLGILIGTIGFGIMIIRNLLDRKSEIATYSAIGYNSSTITKLLFTENIIIFISGLIIGLSGSLIGILPSLLSESYSLPGNFVLILMGAIIINVFLWIYLPVRNMTNGIKFKDLTID